ncbi:MAG TPA: cupin domain-containing protein [Gaiellales bacterium]|jgi:quercetin dioxygenase-like cupin family protein
MALHHVILAGAKASAPATGANSQGAVRMPIVGPQHGAMHTDVARVELAGGDRTATHAHAFEQSVYVLSGSPTIELDGVAWQAGAGEGALIPVGAAHALAAERGPATWLEIAAPPARPGTPEDTWPIDAAAAHEGRSRWAFRDPGEQPATLPTDAAIRFGGSTIRMLLDAHHGAALHTLFTVRFAPGASLAAHDHPFEEAYVVLAGRVDAVADGDRITLGPGDALWTAVGCIHAFANPYDVPVRWLETQAPQPPARYAFRFVPEA